MSRRVCLCGGPIFDGRNMLPESSILFDEEGILEIAIGAESIPAGDRVDVNGQLIVPGLVDLHCDVIEKCVEMRPNVFFDADFAIGHLDQRLAACGITSFCHAISFTDNELGLRSARAAEKLALKIRAFSESKKACIRHLVHARYEIDSSISMEIISRLIEQENVDVLSLMDHTPGQGQFRTIQSYVDFYTRNYGKPEDEILVMLERKSSRRKTSWEKVSALTKLAHDCGIPILSHDDDTKEKVDLVHALNAGGSEFPVRLDAALAARDVGMQVFMGAPNLLRGSSANGNLKAITAINENVCSGLISDYYPESLLHAPFVAHKQHGIALADVFKLITTNPAAFLNQNKRSGCLQPGAAADFIVLDTASAWPRVTQTWVGGSCVFSSR
jgi:alpha-D-ribose 1-methylphosphonate 5-triphosphate diphosphatase